MAKKIWKLSKFSGGLNSFTNPYDLTSDEFAEFEDVTSSERGIAKTIGQSEKKVDIQPLIEPESSNTYNSLLKGAGLYSYNVDYSPYVAGTNNIDIELGVTIPALDGYPGEMEIQLNSVLWLFDTAMPTSGKLTFQAKINDVAIMEPVTMLEAGEGLFINGARTTNLFDKPTFARAINNGGWEASFFAPDWGDVGALSGISLGSSSNADFSTCLPYNVHDLHMHIDSTDGGTFIYAETIAAFGSAAWLIGPGLGRPTALSLDQEPHPYTFFDDDFDADFAGVTPAIEGDYQIDDFRWPLGWDGQSNMADRYALGFYNLTLGSSENGDNPIYYVPGAPDYQAGWLNEWVTGGGIHLSNYFGTSYWPSESESYFSGVLVESGGQGGWGEPELSATTVLEARRHTWRVMKASFCRELIKGINNYDFTILTVDDLTRPGSHTAWQASQTHTNITQTSSDGNGIGLTVNISTDGSGHTTFVIVTGGKGYAVDEEITFTDPHPSGSNTAILIVATLGGTTAQDKYDATFYDFEDEDPDFEPHFLSHLSNGYDFWMRIRPKSIDYENFHLESINGLKKNLFISLTSSSLDDTGSPHTGTPAQVAQLTFKDTGINTAEALTANEAVINIPAGGTFAGGQTHIVFRRGDIIKIDDGSNPEIMQVAKVQRNFPGEPKLHVLRGDPNYWGIPESARSGASSQNVAHSTNADIYIDSSRLIDDNFFDDYMSTSEISGYDDNIQSTMHLSGIASQGNTFVEFTQLSTPSVFSITINSPGVDGDGMTIYLDYTNEDAFGTQEQGSIYDNNLNRKVFLIPPGASTVNEIFDVLQSKVGNIKKSTNVSATNTLIAGVDNLAFLGSSIIGDGTGYGKGYFFPVDTSKIMVVNTATVVPEPGTPFTVVISSGMDNFSVGDWVATGNTLSTHSGFYIFTVSAKSGTGSSGTITLVDPKLALQGTIVGELNSPTSIAANQIFTRMRDNRVLAPSIGDVIDDYAFTMSYEIVPGGLLASSKFYKDDEIMALIGPGEESLDGGMWNDIDYSGQLNVDADYIFKMSVNFFSNYLKTWIFIEDTATGYNLRDQLGWVWYRNIGQILQDSTQNEGIDTFPKPLFFDEGNRLRIIDTNFNLVTNKNKWFGYADISRYFKDLPDSTTEYSTWEWPDSVSTKGYMLENSSVEWNFSVPDKDSNEPSDDETIRGLSVSNDAATFTNSISPTYFGDNFARMYIRIQKSSGSSDGIDWGGLCKFYASAVYDDGGETGPVHKFDSDIDFGEISETDGTEALQIDIQFRPADGNGNLCFPDKRITGIRLYLTNEIDAFASYTSLGLIDFRYGFIKAADTIRTGESNYGVNYVWKDKTVSGHTNALKIYDIYDDDDTIRYTNMPTEETFELFHGYHPTDVATLSARYKAITIAGGRSFIGNIEVHDGIQTVNLNDTMIVSPFGQVDIHPYPANILELDISDGDAIVALASIGEKVLQFKRKVLYIMNISTGIPKEFFVEERHKFKGIMNRNHFCDASEGIFWFNDVSAYFYNGETVRDLFIKGGEADEDNGKRIGSFDWKNFVSKDSICGYNPNSHEIFVVKSSVHTHDTDTGDCYIYNEISDNWCIGKRKFWSGKGRDLTFDTLSPTPNTAWTVNQLGSVLLSPASVLNDSGTATGSGMLVTAITDEAGNPTFTLKQSGSGYNVDDKIIFYDPAFSISPSDPSQTIPQAELTINTIAFNKFITNLVNHGDDSKLSYLTYGDFSDPPGPTGDGSPT